MEIKTDNKPRPIVFGFELSENILSEFDYMEGEELDNAEFVKYKGNYYHLGDIEAITNLPDDSPLNGWHGMVSETFFSAVLFKFTDDFEHVICGHAFS